VALSLTLTGCPPPVIRPPAVGEPGSYGAKASQAGLTIAADPYADPDKSKAVFGFEMISKGLLAVNLVFENAGEKKFFVYTNQITFEDANGEKYQKLQASQVASAVEGTGFVGGTESPGVSVGIMGLSTHPSPSLAQRYLEVSLAGSVLAPRSRAHGFVFFGLGKDRVVTGKVSVPVHDTAEDKILIFEVPIP
jgi:hypothetical protein